MNAVTEFDVGPLTWVKSEIDLALERAGQALKQYEESVVADAGDLTQLKFCRTHLHQVQGALTIVGLDGVTQFAEAVEAMLEAIEQQSRPPEESSITLAQLALATIGHYLDDLINGQPNQPLRLLSLYREVQAARGLEHVSATDLFFPDLTARPPRRETPAKKITQSQFHSILRQERARFQRGLLLRLRSPQDRSGISEMLGVVQRIEDIQETASARAFWWIAGGFLSALAEGALPEEANSRQLCARIDLQIRRLLEGSKNVAERLMRDALYLVASAHSNNSLVRLVKKTYQLQALIPTTETAAPAPEETVRRKLREVITATEEAWNKYCTGSMQSLPMFKEHANALTAVVEQLGHTDYRRLVQAIAAGANWLSDDSTRQSEALAMEIATAILLTQNAQENFQRLGSDFAHQVDVTVARIHGCLAGAPPQPGSEIPLLDEMSRQAQEKLLVGQVAKEIQSNFAQIEQVLDGFFRDVAKRTDLASLEVPFRQVAGALTMMRHDSAVEAVRECAAEIKRFSDPEYESQETDFERVANQLSLIGFFIDSLQHGASDFDSFVKQMQSGLAQDVKESAETEEDEGEVPGITLEQEVDRQKLETHALLGALKEQQGDTGLREEIKLNLVALKNDADLVADSALGEQTKAMLSALATGEDASAQIDQVMASLKPQLPETIQPSAETVQLAQASNEEVDAELLGIFLEEANEVLITIDENLKVLKNQPHDIAVLTTIRRSFHTLKGSGRMVGLKDVGEVAWSIEQTLNHWLQQELQVGPSLVELLGQAHTIFASWVRYLETQSGSAPDAGELVAFSEYLRRGKEDDIEVTAPIVADPASLDVVAEPEISVTDDVALEAPQELLELVHSAEIITLKIPSTQAASDDGDITIDLEADEMVDVENFDFAVPLNEEPVQVADAAPLSVEPQADESVALEPGTQQRISISPALFAIFSEEASTHLETLRNELPVLENDEITPTPHAMCRAAHTLAGISATVGITSVNRLGLALEHALLRRDNSAQPGSLEALGIIRQAIGELDQMLSGLAGQQEPEVPPGLIEALDDLFPANVVTPLEQSAADANVPEHAEASPPQEEAGAESAPRAAFVPETQQLQDEIDQQLLPIFLEEALDLNQGIATQLRAWRSEPGNSEAVRTLTRMLHTLKGSARMAGAMNLGEIAHAIETRVEQANNTGNAPPEVIDEIDNAFDVILHIIEGLQRGESLEQPPGPTAENPVADATGKVEPAGAPERHVFTEERRVDRVRLVEPEVEGDVAAQRATLRVRADLIDRLVNEAGELSIARARIEGEMRSLKESLLDLTENVIRLRRQLREIEIQAESQMQSRSAQTDERHAGFDPLELDRFTRFQELTRMMAESVNDVATVQQNLLKNLDDANAAIIAQARLNREVQQELLAVRMVPFGSLADRLYRIVRQTSKELNKRVNLEISGSQVELDRSVLDKMGAPLEHMLRNAIAHGLEERDVRLARGKPDIGEISLALKQEGNEIILSFSDDGAGLDLERIRARAIESGLLGADEAVDAAHLADLIFTPGFSTASEVSQVAGRGVGMDVVKTEVSSLGGRIEIVSTPGHGTEFRIYIPLTLAVTKALLVRVGSKRYAIPSVMIEQVLDLKEAVLTRIRDAGTAEWMGQHYPFSFLPHLLGDTSARPEQHRQYWVLLLRSGTRRIAVQVDELQGNQEIVVKNIGPQLARVIGVDGATVLGNGQVVLILNPVALSTRTVTGELAAQLPATPLPDSESATATLPTVMVVDDSLTVRKITGRLLAREGYQVILAKDGVDALEHLLDVIPDVMLVDIEMPRMDGFDLTRNIRADERLKAIPIIMITSRTASKHRAYAFEIGANQYLGKPYQEEELLLLVAEYIKQQRHA
jgi:chemosensory pili system protein ChpA (sensor histidine kinase/response regulator)